MNTPAAPRAVTTMASPMIIGKDEPFLTKLAFVVVALIIGVACFTALMALLGAVMPRTAARCRMAVSRWPVQAVLAGALTYLVGGGLAWFFLSRGYVPRLLKVEIVPGMLVPGLAAASVLLLVTVLGAAGTVRAIGERLTAGAVPAATPAREIVVGTLAAALGSGFPVVGWALALPGLLFASSGALIVGIARGRGGA